MALSDPFDTTFQGSFKAGQSLGQGIDDAAGSVADQMKLQNQRKMAHDILTKTGMLKEDVTPPSVDELKSNLQEFGKKTGRNVNFNIAPDTDEDTQRKFLEGIHKAYGIPMPKGQTNTTLNLTPGTEYDPVKGLITMSGMKPVDPMVKEMQAQRLDLSKQRIKDQEDKTQTQEWDKLDKIVDPNIATNRSPLGMAGRANMSADRAIKTLQSPMVTNQEAGNVMADVASIYQNGSPTEFGMSEQGYNTLQAKIAGMQQYFSGKPTDALTPDIKKRLQDVLYGMKDTNKSIIKQNLDYVEKAHGKLVKSDPDKWKDMRSVLEAGDYRGGQSQAEGVLGAAGMGKNKSDQDDLSKMTDEQLKAIINGR